MFSLCHGYKLEQEKNCVNLTTDVRTDRISNNTINNIVARRQDGTEKKRCDLTTNDAGKLSPNKQRFHVSGDRTECPDNLTNF